MCAEIVLSHGQSDVQIKGSTVSRMCLKIAGLDELVDASITGNRFVQKKRKNQKAIAIRVQFSSSRMEVVELFAYVCLYIKVCSFKMKSCNHNTSLLLLLQLFVY